MVYLVKNTLTDTHTQSQALRHKGVRMLCHVCTYIYVHIVTHTHAVSHLQHG